MRTWRICINVTYLMQESYYEDMRVCINDTYLMQESSYEDMEGMYQCHLHNAGKCL